jgi:amino acid permease
MLCFGTCCAYFVILGDFLTPVLSLWINYELNKFMIMGISIIFLFPLALLTKINLLSYTRFLNFLIL